MHTRTPTIARLTPEDVERAAERDDKRYELIEGQLREKSVGMRELFIAGQITGRLNAALYPREGFAVVGGRVYCFDRPDHGRKPEVVYLNWSRTPDGRIPQGDIFTAPDLVAEVLTPTTSAVELHTKLDEYLTAGVPRVWIVNPNAKTIRVYRSDGTMRLYRATEVIENDPLLPSFVIAVGDVFPAS